MKLKQLLFTLLALLASSNAAADDQYIGSEYETGYSAEIDGIYYVLTGFDARVAYQGAYYDVYYSDLGAMGYDEYRIFQYAVSDYSGNIVIPESVTYGSHTYPVTGINDYAFSGCSSLLSVTIPQSVTSIGDYAFSGCSSLTSVTIPQGVTSIGSRAIENCSSLTSMTIPNSVTSISHNIFFGCSSLTSIVVESGNTVFDSRDNCNAIIMTASNTLFRGCRNTIIPQSVTSIGLTAFSGCSSLTSITIPNSVTKIGNFAFTGCSSLTSITIPNSVTDIGSYAFYECYFARDSFIINSGLTDSYTFGATLYDIGTDDGLLINNNTVVKCRPCATSVIIPDGVKRIGYQAFLLCTSLTSITIPNSVTQIDDDAFWGCSNLTSITIPNSVTSIERYAFFDCSSLTSITIPNSVTKIDDGAFCLCI